jgi:hypothetical protein
MLAEFAARVITLPKEEENMMRKTLIGLTALGGILAMTAYGAQAAPDHYYGGTPYEGRHATQADYYWHHEHWHHRQWEHHHWHYN